MNKFLNKITEESQTGESQNEESEPDEEGLSSQVDFGVDDRFRLLDSSDDEENYDDGSLTHRKQSGRKYRHSAIYHYGKLRILP